MRELDQAPFGIVGLETALGLVVTQLIEPGHLDWPTALAKMTINPARILGIDKGTLRRRRRRRRHDHRSRRPLDGRPARSSAPRAATRRSPAGSCAGRADTVIVGGRVKYQAPAAQAEAAAARASAGHPRLSCTLARRSASAAVHAVGIALTRSDRCRSMAHAAVIDGYNLLHASGILGPRRSGPGGLERSRDGAVELSGRVARRARAGRHDRGLRRPRSAARPAAHGRASRHHGPLCRARFRRRRGDRGTDPADSARRAG